MERISEIKHQLDLIISKLIIITSNNNKDELITTNGQAISNIVMTMACQLDGLERKIMETDNRIKYLKNIMPIAHKTENLTELKYLLKVIQIELDQL